MDDLLTWFSVCLSGIFAIIGGWIGGSIGGRYALKATQKAHENQKNIADETEARIVKSLLQAIHDELETVFDQYQETMGNRIEALEKNQPLAFYYPLASDFFSVYHGNTFLIGRVKDHVLRKAIIKTYSLAKGLLDSYKMNNDIIHKWEHWSLVFAETQMEVHKIQAEAYRSSLINYAEVLKKMHEDVKVNLKETTRMLALAGIFS